MNFISRAVNIGFGIIFAITIALSFGKLAVYLAKTSYIGIPAAILIILTALLAVYGLYRLESFLKNHVGDDTKKARRIFWALLAVLLVMQIIMAVAVPFESINDLSHITRATANLITLGSDHLYDGVPLMHHHYFAVYPNNHALFLYVYALYRITYAVTGEISNFLPVVFNIVGLDLSYIFMYKIAKRIYSPSRALVSAVRGLLFLPLITYVSFFYTDSLAMPFITAGAYFYIKWRFAAEGEAKLSQRLVPLITAALCIALAYKIKGSAIILLIAIAIDICLRKIKPLKKLGTVCLLAAVLVAVSAVISMTAVNILQISDEESDGYKFPLIHWVMMSADGDGGYHYTDFSYTKSHYGYENKVKADEERLAEKLDEQGVLGFAHHLVIKLTYTWKDGTYMTGYYYSGTPFFNTLLFYFIAEAAHFTLLITVCRGYLSNYDSKDDALSQPFFLKVTLMGLLAFLLIWEARCRYLVSFFLLFALI